MEKPITIIVPIYNVQFFLEECLSSISKQTYSNIEILLINDGSTDNSKNIAEKYVLIDSRYKLYNKVNGGLSSARNYGIKKASGDYIIFIDSDDSVEPNFVERLYSSLIETDADISMCGYKELNFSKSDRIPIRTDLPCVNNMKTHSVNQFELWNECYYENNCSSAGCTVVWNKIYKKSLFNDLFFDEGKIFEDDYINFKLFDRCKKITIIPDCLYRYRRKKTGSITADFHGNKKERLTPLLLRHIYFTKHKFELKICVEFFKMFTQLYFFDEKNKEFDKSYKKYVFALFLRQPNNLIFIKTIIKILCKKLYVFKKNKSAIESTAPKQNDFEIKSNTLFIGTPTHGNLGDQAITIATLKFLDDLRINYTEISFEEYYKNYDYIQKLNPKTIFLQGGGNIGNAWIEEEKLRWDIILSFPNAKIVIFPQTIWFENTLNKATTIENIKNIYSDHKNLTVVAREEKSYAEFKKLCPKINVLLCPDIVLSNEPREKKLNKDKYVVVLKRKDKENNDESTNKIEALCTELKQLGYKLVYADTVIGKIVDYHNREEELNKLLNILKQSYFVITDRLHGMIFSYITSTPVLVYGNYNFKVLGTYNLLPKKDYVFYNTSLCQLPKILVQIESYYKTSNKFTSLDDKYIILKDIVKKYK